MDYKGKWTTTIGYRAEVLATLGDRDFGLVYIGLEIVPTYWEKGNSTNPNLNLVERKRPASEY